MTSWVATVEPNHTVRVPAEVAAGEQVLIVRVPSLTALLSDPERRARFAATRAAIDSDLRREASVENISSEQVVNLVKEARRASKE